MLQHLSRGLLVAGLLVGFTTILAGADATTSYHYDVALTPELGSTIPYTGTLDLTIDSSGIVNGYYHPSDNMTAMIDVSGGRNGKNIWLDIGRTGGLRVTGKFVGDAIHGMAIGAHPTHDPLVGSTSAMFTFTATPSKKPGT